MVFTFETSYLVTIISNPNPNPKKLLIEFNKTPVTNIASMEDAVSKVQSGTESVQKFLRGNQEMTCTAKF